MTDADIIKALAFCSDPDSTCDRCVLFDIRDESCECASKLRLEAIALIIRQKAEVEEKSNKLREVLPIVAEIKAESIKEFAERLKERKCHYTETEHTFNFDGVDVDEIDNLVKEMVGEGK